MLTLLRKKATAYAGRHADDHRAPTGTECDICEVTEPGTPEVPVTLARCSICEVWICTPCYSQHSADSWFYAPAARRSWWKRVTSRA